MNHFELKARDAKAAAMLQQLRKAAGHALTPSTLEQLDYAAWESAARLARFNPPSEKTIARAIELVRLANGENESAVPQ